MRRITPAHNDVFGVLDLINGTNASWREELVRNSFLPIDATTILGLPVCTRNISDFWSWAHETNGCFLVFSAYRMLVSTKISREVWLEGNSGNSDTESAAKQ